MTQRNLADPAYEPTDDELVELAGRAGAGVSAQRAHIEVELRARVARERAVALAALAASRGGT